MVHLMYRIRAVSDGWQGGPGLTQWYFNDGSGGTTSGGGQALDIVNRVHGALSASTTLWSSDLTWTINPDVDILEPETGDLVDTYSVTAPSPVVGSASGTLGPADSGLCMHFHTNDIVTSHRVRGRTFLVPLGSGLQGTPAPNSGTRAAVVALGDALKDTGTTPAQLVVWHRKKGALAGSSHEVTSVTCSATFCVLRSRRR